MHTLLAQSSPVLFLVIAGFCLGALAIGLSFLNIASRLFKGMPGQVPTPAFMGVVSMAWALSMGFAASDVWSLDARADSAATAERSAVMRLIGVSDESALNLPAMNEAVRNYADLARTTEWQETLNRVPNPLVDDALQEIRIGIVDMVKRGIASPLVSKAVNDFDELQDARNERLAIGQTAVDLTKWYLVLCLTVMAMITIAMVHAEVPKAGRNALAIFSVVVCVCLWILAMHTNPYKGMPVTLFASTSSR